jgi:AcrR family transcriptional regulator
MRPQPARQRARERRLQYREDTCRAILDAAEELLVEGGLDAFSMRRLAERCGCTAPTLYHYFRDKTSLIDALLEERLAKLVAELRAVELSGDAARDVRVMCSAFARFGVRNPSHYQLLMLHRADEAEEQPSGKEAQAIIQQPLEALVVRGVLPEQELETLRQGLWSLLHGFILLQWTRPDEDWVPDLLDRSLDAMIRGTLERTRAAERGSPT